MANKYPQEEGVRKFYYQPGTHYCAVIARDRRKVREVRHKVLEHYLGEGYEYKQVLFLDPGKGKPVGALIHVQGDIARILMHETRFEDIDILLSPVDFGVHKQRKASLQQLVNKNS